METLDQLIQQRRAKLESVQKQGTDPYQAAFRRDGPIADILAGPTPRPLLVRATYALLASGLLEDAAAPAPKVEVVEEDAGTFKMAMAAPRVPRHAAAREEIRRLYEALPRSTHYDVLGVSPDATELDVASAHTRLQADYEARWSPLEQDPELGTAVFTIKLRRREAFEVLSDPRRRDSYDRSLAGESTPGAGTGAARAGAGPDASGLLKQAEALLEKHEADRALPLLMKAVEVDPKFRPARRLLAILLAQDPNLAASAERHFLAALEQDADDVDLRYRLARYYKKLGLNARAILQLRIVLGKDPEHVAAWNDLRELEKETRSGRP